MDKVRIGLVGLYGIANHHMQEIKATPELKLGAVCDINTTLATAWSEEHQVPWYEHYQDLFQSKDCDFVIISAPHYLHCDMACAAMEAGKPVIIQKPMCLTVAEADRIIATAKRTGVKVATYHTAHTSEWDVIQAVRAGLIGDPMRFSYAWHASRGIAYYRSGPWRGKWATEGSGMLSNQCIHDINRIQNICGPVAEITNCTLANIGHPDTEVEDSCIAALRYANGAQGLFYVTLYSQPQIHRYEVMGNLGCIVVNDGERKLGAFSYPLREYLTTHKAVRKPRATLEDAERPATTWGPVPEVEKPASTTVQFARAVRDGAPAYITPELALRDIEVWNGLILSHFRRKAVKLPLDRAEYSALFEELKAGKHDIHWK
jgi:predicted dehydrogenase